VSWNDPPRAGEVWWCSRQRRRRTVVDRNLGGDVFYRTGGPWRYSVVKQCTEAEWKAWEAGAVLIDEAEVR
jgi:hypothetical protein